jgi:hypothetical protein
MRVSLLVLAVAAALYGAATAQAQFFSHVQGSLSVSVDAYYPSTYVLVSLVDRSNTGYEFLPSGSLSLPPTTYDLPGGDTLTVSYHAYYSTTPTLAYCGGSAHLSIGGPTDVRALLHFRTSDASSIVPNTFMYLWIDNPPVTGYVAPLDTVWAGGWDQARLDGYGPLGPYRIPFNIPPNLTQPLSGIGSFSYPPYYETTPTFKSLAIPQIGVAVENFDIEIDHTGGGATSYVDFFGDPGAAWQPSPVPEPTTLTICGSALLGLGVVHLRRRRAKAGGSRVRP